MRKLIYLLFGLLLMTLSAQAEDNRPRVRAVAVTGDPQAATIHLSLSAPASYAVNVQPGRVEITLPTALWNPTVPARGKGGGIIGLYRKEASTRGVTLVFTTPDEVRIDRADIDQSNTVTVALSRPAASSVIIDPYTGPLVVESTGFPIVPTANTAPIAPMARPATPEKVPIQPVCVPSTERDGTINGIPVYKFTDCNKAH